MVFQPGKSGNEGGRIKGSLNVENRAVQKARRCIADVFMQSKNQKVFKIELQKRFDEDSIKFYKELLRDIVPKDVNFEVSGNLNISFTDFLKENNGSNS